MSSLPSVQDVRARIESCKNPQYRMYLKAVYLCGAARAAELCGKPCGGPKTRFVYGPRGTDVSLAYTDPPDLTNMEFVKLLLNIMQNKEDTNKIINQLSEKIPVALFKIKIAKQHLEPNEEPPFRLVALPLPEKYEPWTKELYEYSKQAGDDYIFPFERQEVWRYLVFVDPIFKGLTYKIKKYTYLKTGIVAFKVLPHARNLRIHGLRHVRTDELLKTYHFDGFDLAAYIGWSMGTAKNVSAMPAQANTYAEVRENWQRYIKKLCIIHDNGAS